MKRILILLLTVFFVSSANAAPIDITYNDGIYHIILSGDKIRKRISFVVSDGLMSNREAHKRARSEFTINAGFFDPDNEKTISYIVTDRNTAADPMFNENIYSNPILRRNLDKILNRTEFRVVECDNKYRYEIVSHKSGVDFGCNIITSAQGGPLVYPQLKLEEEFFVVKDENGDVVRESASVLHKTARTIIGIKDGDAHILIITEKNPMDMYEVQKLCKKLGLDRAMAFDGGSSTSMNYKDKIEVVSSEDGGRLLKSFMIIPKK